MKKIYLFLFIIALVFISNVRSASAIVPASPAAAVPASTAIVPAKAINSQIQTFSQNLSPIITQINSGIASSKTIATGNSIVPTINNFLHNFGFLTITPSVADKTIVPALTTAAKNFQINTGIVSATGIATGIFDQATIITMRNIATDFQKAASVLPIGVNSFVIAYPDGSVASFDAKNGNFSAPTNDPNDPVGMAIWCWLHHRNPLCFNWNGHNN